MPRQSSTNVYLVGDAARALQCSPTHVGRLVRSGRATPSLRIAGGPRVAFTETELLALAETVGRPIRLVSITPPREGGDAVPA